MARSPSQDQRGEIRANQNQEGSHKRRRSLQRLPQRILALSELHKEIEIRGKARLPTIDLYVQRSICERRLRLRFHVRLERKEGSTEAEACRTESKAPEREIE